MTPPQRSARDAGFDEPYRDDPTSPEALSEQDTVGDGQNEALSFLGIDDDGAADDEESPDGLTTYQQKHSFLRHFPPRIRRGWVATIKWLGGPQPPRVWRITPLFEEVQTYHLKLLDRYAPKKIQKFWLLVGFYFLWLLTFSLMLWKSAFAGDVKGYGKPAVLSCSTKLWRRGSDCGLNGDLCRPFDSNVYAFRCPASCGQEEIYEPYAVGNRTFQYQNMVIGGPPNDSDNLDDAYYRGDSFICSAAIHAGYLSDRTGGCGVVRLTGDHATYPASDRNHVKSVEFNSWFPLSFQFVQGKAEACKDLRWQILGVTLTFSIVLSLFVTSPAVFFCSVFVGLFTHVALVSDPPPLSNYYSLISTAFGRFLPASFCMAVMYLVAVRRTLTGLTAQYEKTVLWLGACWVGALNNYTFDKIPIQRLTPHDLKQPGAIPALITIICVIITIVLGQAWCLRVEGKFFKYLTIYAIMGSFLLLLVAVPGLNVRIHHYILALLFLPGTAMQNRPSLLYQGLLVGFFINGIARWGFDSIVQTWIELRGDAPLNSLIPELLPPIIHMNDGFFSTLYPNITFEWIQPNLELGYDGISILINDVERYKGYMDVGEGKFGGMSNFTFVREKEWLDVPVYFRFAFLRGSGSEDYTRGGTWNVDGTWQNPQPGSVR